MGVIGVMGVMGVIVMAYAGVPNAEKSSIAHMNNTATRFRDRLIFFMVQLLSIHILTVLV
jgi:hypothetical protein